MKTIYQSLIAVALFISVLTSCSPKYTASFHNHGLSYSQSMTHSTSHYPSTINSENITLSKTDELIDKAQRNLQPVLLASTSKSIPIETPTSKAIKTLIEVRNKKVNPNSSNVNHSKAEIREAKKILKTEIKMAKREFANVAPEGKSQLVALLLAIFVGSLGIHRFYLGYIGIGVVQLLTLGGCGIWALIDLIRIITGDLKPKGSEYGKKL